MHKWWLCLRFFLHPPGILVASYLHELAPRPLFLDLRRGVHVQLSGSFVGSSSSRHWTANGTMQIFLGPTDLREK